MAFNFKGLKDYYSKTNVATSVIANNQISHDYSQQIQEAKIVGIAKPSDRKSIFQYGAGGGSSNHMNNYETGYISVSPNPDKREGTSVFKFSENMPNGGSSYQTFTRLKYNNYFARIRPTDAPWTGNDSVPAGVTDNIRSMRLSDEDLENTYHKRINGSDFVDLRTEAERNNPRTPLWLKAPFVQRGMQRGKDNPKGPLERINMLTAPVIDTVRVAKFLGSPKGLIFMLKQQGLQLTNPKGEFLSPLHSSRIFNPLAFALQVPLTQFGVHIDRHFLGPANTEESNYEKRIHKKNKLQDGKQNRLVKLSKLNVEPGMPILPLTGIMGPHSLFGIGKTTHFKHTSGKPSSLIGALASMIGLGGNDGDTNDPYTGEAPYKSGMAWGENSDASKGTDLEKIIDDPLEKLNTWGDAPISNMDKEYGDVDPGGVNPGSYQTSTYQQLQDGQGNHPFVDDEGETADKYGNNKLKDYNQDEQQSKFGSEEQGNLGTPFAMTATDNEILAEFPDNAPHDDQGLPTFDVFAYTDIVAFRKNSKSFRDFRSKDEEDGYENNLIATRNLKEYGKTAGHEFGTNTFDEVTLENPDVVKVNIGDVWFRAYINDFSDKVTTGYTDVSYTGIATKGKQYDNISRAWTLDLAMPAFTALDLQWNYKRLNSIMQLAAPETSGEHAGGQLTNITLGDLWIDMPTIITSVDYEVDNDIGWDIGIPGIEEKITEMKTTSTKILPMYFNLKIGGDFLGDVNGSVWNSTSNFFNESIWSDIT